MADYKLTRLAAADLATILEYTLKSWLGKQGERYLGDLQAWLEDVTARPRLGRKCETIRPGLMRIEYGRHAIFFRIKKYGIRVIRILHQSMMPELHGLGDSDFP